MSHKVNRWSMSQLEVTGLQASGEKAVAVLGWGVFALLLVVGHLAFTVRDLANNQGFVPWVVEMNGFGEIRSFGEAERVVQEDRLVVLHLRKVVQSMRTVSRDQAIQKSEYGNAARFIAGSKREELKYFYTDPGRLDGQWVRTVKVGTVLLHGAGAEPGTQVWEVSWREDIVDKTLVHRSAWRGLFTTGFEEVKDPGVLTYNPFGFVIHDFSIGPTGEPQQFSIGEQDALLGLEVGKGRQR